jgi:hypothetical protein
VGGSCHGGRSKTVNWRENLVAGCFVLAQLGIAICMLAVLGARNRRKSAFRLMTDSQALLDRRNVTAHGHGWQRRMRWILLIVAATLLLTTGLLHVWQ